MRTVFDSRNRLVDAAIAVAIQAAPDPYQILTSRQTPASARTLARSDMSLSE